MIYSDIIEKGAEIFNVSIRDIYPDVRVRHIVRARMAIYKALYLRGASYTRIGALMKRDHTTVMHGVRVATYLMQDDPDYKAKVEQIVNLSIDLGYNEKEEDNDTDSSRGVWGVELETENGLSGVDERREPVP